jgi:ribosome modulation factor
MSSRSHVSQRREQLDELDARFEEAERRGRCDYAEGVPGNVAPYEDEDLKRRWLVGWWHGFKNDRRTA